VGGRGDLFCKRARFERPSVVVVVVVVVIVLLVPSISAVVWSSCSSLLSSFGMHRRAGRPAQLPCICCAVEGRGGARWVREPPRGKEGFDLVTTSHGCARHAAFEGPRLRTRARQHSSLFCGGFACVCAVLCCGVVRRTVLPPPCGCRCQDGATATQGRHRRRRQRRRRRRRRR
jgi:hypothetical protein